MNNDQFDKLPTVQANRATSNELIIIDETNSIQDNTVRPPSDATRKRIEEYWEEVKKYCPEEYEEMMKRRQSGS
jgi:hypothetical protein